MSKSRCICNLLFFLRCLWGVVFGWVIRSGEWGDDDDDKLVAEEEEDDIGNGKDTESTYGLPSGIMASSINLSRDSSASTFISRS